MPGPDRLPQRVIDDLQLRHLRHDLLAGGGLPGATPTGIRVLDVGEAFQTIQPTQSPLLKISVPRALLPLMVLKP